MTTIGEAHMDVIRAAVEWRKTVVIAPAPNRSTSSTRLAVAVDSYREALKAAAASAETAEFKKGKS